MKKSYPVVLTLLLLVPLFGASASGLDPQKKHTEKIEQRSHGQAGWLGVVIADVSEKMAKEKKLPSQEGAVVEDVTDDSPADSAGIQNGDVVVEIGGTKVSDADNMKEIVASLKPGLSTQIVLYRDGGRKTVTAVIGQRPGMISRRIRVPNPMPRRPGMIQNLRGHGRLGLDLETLNDQLGEYFGTPENSGVLVSEVEKGSRAEKAGFKAGDVIIRVGKKRVDDAGDISRALADAEPGSTVNFEVLRKGASKTIPVAIEERKDDEGFYFDLPDFNIDKGAMDELREEMEGVKHDIENLHIEKRIRCIMPEL